MVYLRQFNMEITMNYDDENYEMIDGKRTKVVCDGGRVVTKMMAMDENTVDAVLRREFLDRQFNDTKLNRPGFRTADTLKSATQRAHDIAGNRIADAYAAYQQDITSAWRDSTAEQKLAEARKTAIESDRATAIAILRLRNTKNGGSVSQDARSSMKKATTRRITIKRLAAPVRPAGVAASCRMRMMTMMVPTS